MTRSYQPIDPSKVRTIRVKQRAHKAGVDRLAAIPSPGASATELFDSFPRYLAAESFRSVVDAVVSAKRHDRPVVVAFGAHVIKVGCSPILIDLIQRGVISAISCNGACAIHDVELALFGETSEEVADTIHDGTFGMVEETMAFFDRASKLASDKSMGLGEAVGLLIIEDHAPHAAHSIFAAATEASIPSCVHVAVGTDTVHMSPNADGAQLGQASLRDFRLICDVVSDLGAVDSSGVGGVWLNVGSAVILPEVFLKAVSIARNLGADLDAMTTANFDMLGHYRPRQNVVTRPVSAGRGFEIIGHHELILPLLRQAIVEKLATEGSE